MKTAIVDGIQAALRLVNKGGKNIVPRWEVTLSRESTVHAVTFVAHCLFVMQALMFMILMYHYVLSRGTRYDALRDLLMLQDEGSGGVVTRKQLQEEIAALRDDLTKTGKRW